jgi:fused signal recognition particle receptor
MILQRIKAGYEMVKKALSSAGERLGAALRQIFQGPLDEAALERLEQLLYEADLGVATVTELIDAIKKSYDENPKLTPDELISLIRRELLGILRGADRSIVSGSEKPTVILVIGVNGNGKTTSIARLAYRFQQQQKSVLVGAADTFRAAAVEQLQMWADNLKIEIVKGKTGGDPAAVAYDAVMAAKARAVDIVLIDTAGRLHTKQPLMKELEKIRRSCAKVEPQAPHETLLVLDATTGQNAIEQTKSFHAITPITGLILTKLDGTAKGGIVVNIEQQLKIPVKFIGIGEGREDLQPFDPEAFVDALIAT